MKVAVVGAGSTYTPELVAGLSGVDELALHDIDANRLAVVGGLARRMLVRQAFGGRLELTGELEAALEGADFVLVQIRVGGQAARLSDETVPLACGCIGQETTGAGGFAKALRTVPVVLDIARRARELAPEAWIVDFTNPVGIVTRALLDDGHRAIGLCNVAIGFERAIARWLGVDPERLVVDQVGLNHLTWVRAVWLDERDVLPDLMESHGDELAGMAGGLPRALLDELGAVPSYYLRYFYAHDEVLAEQLAGATPRAETVAEIERELLEMYADQALNTKPPLLERRGGAFYSEAAIRLVASLVRGDGAVHVVDVRNGTAVAGLAADDVVELPARVDGDGAHPLAQRPLAPELLGLVAHVAAYERLAVEAAVTGGRAVARRALLAHPLVGQWGKVETLLDGLLVTPAGAGR
jgi:6-phospho-beta-glucosidase